MHMSDTLEFGGSGKVESVFVVFCTHSGLLLAKAVCAPQHAGHDIGALLGKKRREHGRNCDFCVCGVPCLMLYVVHQTVFRI